VSAGIASLEPAGGPLCGEATVPGDKSIAHRALLFNAIGDGEALVSGLPEGLDVASTIAALKRLGVGIERPSTRSCRIRGCGLHLKPPTGPIDCGNSGTTMRLLTGILAGQSFDAVLDGDASLRRRPMGRVAVPLKTMGARIDTGAGGCAPLGIRGGTLRGCAHELPVASAQVKSALLLAGLQADGRTCVREPTQSRDHTERLLAEMSVAVERDQGSVCVRGRSVPECCDVSVPGDPSSAAFFVVAAALVPDSEVRIRGVCLNPTRIGFVRLLERMGADIQLLETHTCGAEAVGDIQVRYAPLSGIGIVAGDVPGAIDELPALAVAAARAEGVTTVRGAAELRVKESDRIRAIVSMLAAFGIEVDEYEDGFRIKGCADLAGGARVGTGGDHRIAMAAAVAALVADGPTSIADAAAVAVSFPGFFDTLDRLRCR